MAPKTKFTCLIVGPRIRGAAIGAAGIATLLTAACASAPLPAERMASAESAVRAARELGAESVPSAQLHVKLADEEIQKAKALASDNDNDLASTMLERASADAELAVALAREEGTRTEAERALKQAQDLRSNSLAPTPPN